METREQYRERVRGELERFRRDDPAGWVAMMWRTTQSVVDEVEVRRCTNLVPPCGTMAGWLLAELEAEEYQEEYHTDV